MGCLVVLFSLITPRLVLLVLWITGYLETAYATWVWPTLGFFVLPATTIAYAIAVNDLGSATTLGGTDISVAGAIAIVVGLLLDLGVIGRGARRGRC